MNLAADATIASCERQLLMLQRTNADEIKMPTHIRRSTLGGEAALTQLVMTWAQAHANPVLATYARDKADAQINDLTRRLHGLTAALCVGRATGVSGEIMEPLRAAALDRLKRVQGPRPAEATRGPSVEIVCADHLALGTPLSLYRTGVDGRASIRGRTEYFMLAQELLDNTAPGTYRDNLGHEIGQAIGSLLYEIFRNTDDHALTDTSGNVLEKSIRAVKVSHLSPDKTSLATMADEFSALAAFCKRQTPHPGASQVHLLELSVLDSGPGYAQRLTGRLLNTMSHEEEKDAVLRCFSVDSSKRKKGYGEGLPHVVRLLREKGGFLRLRTGRLSLFADLGAPDLGGDEALSLEEWKLSGETSLPQVSGVLLTIFVPMRRNP
jgi:hypothetical protein